MGEISKTLDYRSPEWVAEQLGIDKNTVYRYLQDGTLPGLQLGRKWLVSERRLADFLERAERQQTERRRRAAATGGRPFGLPPIHLLEEADGGPEA
ncbi:MAG TPA: helix-turn-helix domain-containing protein [Dehalococcoidia bacterium]|nr:helix-turn-helix domain-containing protein [Dehalococcoidia bacterium]